MHDIQASGHLGIKKTLSRLRTRYYWPGCQNDVKVYIGGCEKCAKRKGPIPTKYAPMQVVRSGFSMERLAIDILGELPTTERGNKYILRNGLVQLVHIDRIKKAKKQEFTDESDILASPGVEPEILIPDEAGIGVECSDDTEKEVMTHSRFGRAHKKPLWMNDYVSSIFREKRAMPQTKTTPRKREKEKPFVHSVRMMSEDRIGRSISSNVQTPGIHVTIVISFLKK